MKNASQFERNNKRGGIMEVNEIAVKYYQEIKQMLNVSEKEKCRETEQMMNPSENKGDNFSNTLDKEIFNIKERNINR